MMGIMSLMAAFPAERAVFLREQANKTYDPFPYYLTKNLVEFPMIIAPPFVTFIISYFGIGY